MWILWGAKERIEQGLHWYTREELGEEPAGEKGEGRTYKLSQEIQGAVARMKVRACPRSRSGPLKIKAPLPAET